MLDTFLIPEQAVEAKGAGAALDLGAAAGRRFLLTLHITRIIEQEALDVSIWGSEDGTNFGQKPIAAFPQYFYTGEHQIMVDLTSQPQIKHLRGQWEVNRWGRGKLTPRFTFSVTIREAADAVAA